MATATSLSASPRVDPAIGQQSSLRSGSSEGNNVSLMIKSLSKRIQADERQVQSLNGRIQELSSEHAQVERELSAAQSAPNPIFEKATGWFSSIKNIFKRSAHKKAVKESEELITQLQAKRDSLAKRIINLTSEKNNIDNVITINTVVLSNLKREIIGYSTIERQAWLNKNYIRLSTQDSLPPAPKRSSPSALPDAEARLTQEDRLNRFKSNTQARQAWASQNYPDATVAPPSSGVLDTAAWAVTAVVKAPFQLVGSAYSSAKSALGYGAQAT